MRSEFVLALSHGILLARSSLLLELGGVDHAFSTRRADGADHFDLGPADADPVHEERRRRLIRAAGLGDGPAPVFLRQVHGRRVVLAPEAHRVDGADAVIDVEGIGTGRVLTVRTADCVPLLMADRDGRAVAAVHAGWRGTAAGVVPAAVEAMRQHGVSAARLAVALGPSIRGCCYAVGGEVLQALSPWLEGTQPDRSGTGERGSVDLAEIQALQLRAQGVLEASIAVAPWCTSCREDLFYSYRRQGGRAGRMMALIGRKPVGR